jgi:hypothetical protein
VAFAVEGVGVAVNSAVLLSPTVPEIGVIETAVTVVATVELLPPHDDRIKTPATARIAKNPRRTLFFNREPPIRRLRLLFESTTTLLVTVSTLNGVGRVLRLHESQSTIPHDEQKGSKFIVALKSFWRTSCHPA